MQSMAQAQQASGPSQSLWWNRPMVYWQANQVAITFHSPVSRAQGAAPVIESLKLDILAQFLATHGFTLRSFTLQDVPHPQDPGIDELEQMETEGSHGQGRPSLDLNSEVGKYLFAPASGHGTLAICYFHCANPSLAPVSPGNRHGHGKNGPTPADSTRAIVTLLNQNLDTLRQHGAIPIIAAMPNWMGGANGGITANCPACPPVMVTGDNTVYSNWQFTLPQLSSAMQVPRGDGVTVFVLDTIPTAEDITTSATSAGSNNVLLQSIAEAIGSGQIVIDHQWIPARLAEDIQAGKDLNGTVYGFKMPDHGLFVTGIVHDLVPEANIECVRVLNNSGVGDTAILCQALNAIQQRMEEGTLKDVVINLSLEIMPPDTKLPVVWFGNGDCCCYQAQDLATVIGELGLLRVGLHQMIQSLTAQGAIITAASGNESNTNNRPPLRFGPRYPAAFPEVIAVGAVDKYWQATSYSDFPALPGKHTCIATYGGAIPLAVPPAPLQPSQPKPTGAITWADVEDAVVGVYSRSKYPVLLATDEPPDGYSAQPASHSWTYWSGTSFAAPLISALAARVIEAQRTDPLLASMPVVDVITTAPGQQLLTFDSSALPSTSAFGVDVGVLHAKQVAS